MTTDLNTMQGMAATATGSGASDLPDVWPSGSSATSLTLDDDEGDGDVGSPGNGSRKYERKTRRFAWPDELHRLFVAAIFDLGLKNASPKALMPFMQPTATNAGLTTEHLKSHLQKYRLNYEKSRAEFLAFFDESAKRNGRRRRRTAKSLESHTRFIFPITPSQSGDAGIGGGHDAADEKTPPSRADAVPQGPVYPSQSLSQLTPRSRLERANLLRLAQQNAAMALASQSAMGGYGAGFSPRDGPSGVEGVSDAQWNILANLLSPQVPPMSGSSVAPVPFSLNEEASPDMQLQMHLAMQAQMNLHRQMLTRKVAVSQHYYSQAAAVKRAAASAMVERALQTVSTSQPQPQSSGRHVENARYSDQQSMPPPRPSIGDNSLLQQQQQLHLHHHQQRYVSSMNPPSSSSADAMLGPPWESMDIDMGINSDDQTDLFSFLKSNE